MCSVPFGLVALGLVAPGLDDGSRGHGRVSGLGRRGRVAPDDLARGRRIWLGLAVAALHDLGLDVAGLHHGRRVDDGRRVRELGPMAAPAF